MGYRQMNSAVIVGQERRRVPAALKRVDAKLVALWWWYVFKRWMQRKSEHVDPSSSGAAKQGSLSEEVEGKWSMEGGDVEERGRTG